MNRMTKLIAAVAMLAVLSLSSAFAQSATFQFPFAGWQSYAPGKIECGYLLGANMNSTLDQAIQISVPSATYMVDSIVVSNPSVSLTTSAGGFYSAASKGGIAVVADTQAYSPLTTNAANTTGNAMLLTLSTAGTTTDFQGPTQSGAVKTIYLSLTTPEGAAATADVRIFCRPMY